jgi:hypothetical protein
MQFIIRLIFWRSLSTGWQRLNGYSDAFCAKNNLGYTLNPDVSPLISPSRMIAMEKYDDYGKLLQ